MKRMNLGTAKINNEGESREQPVRVTNEAGERFEECLYRLKGLARGPPDGSEGGAGVSERMTDEDVGHAFGVLIMACEQGPTSDEHAVARRRQLVRLSDEMAVARRLEQEQAEKLKKQDEVMTKAAAELRHAFRAIRFGGKIDPGLVERAIQMLERATF